MRRPGYISSRYYFNCFQMLIKYWRYLLIAYMLQILIIYGWCIIIFNYCIWSSMHGNIFQCYPSNSQLIGCHQMVCQCMFTIKETYIYHDDVLFCIIWSYNWWWQQYLGLTKEKKDFQEVLINPMETDNTISFGWKI